LTYEFHDFIGIAYKLTRRINFGGGGGAIRRLRGLLHNVTIEVTHLSLTTLQYQQWRRRLRRR